MAFMLLAEWAVVMFISPMEAFIIVIKGIAWSVVKWVYSPGTASAFIVALWHWHRFRVLSKRILEKVWRGSR